MALSEDEKSRIMHYLGYPKQSALEQSYATGYAITHAYSQKYLFDAFQRIDAHGEARVREDLQQLACIDQQLIALRANAGVKSAGEVQLDAEAGRRLLKMDRVDYVRRLCDDLGVELNTRSQQYSSRVRQT